MLRIKLVRSLIGHNKRNKATVTALGLRKMHQTVDHKDTPNIRGMIHHVKDMLQVSEISEAEARPNSYKLKPAGGIKATKPKAERAKKAVKPKKVAPVQKPKRAKPVIAVKKVAKAKTKVEAKAAPEPKAKAAPKPKVAAKPKAETKAPAKKAPAKKKEAGK